jgi:hypothetical protein
VLHAVLDEHARRRTAVVKHDLKPSEAETETTSEFEKELPGGQSR